MPIITHITYSPRPLQLGRVCSLDVTVRSVVIGPIVFTLQLEPLDSYFFAIANARASTISRKRWVVADIGKFTTRMAFRVVQNIPTAGDALLIVGISAPDGVSAPHPIRLEIAPGRRSAGQML